LPLPLRASSLPRTPSPSVPPPLPRGGTRQHWVGCAPRTRLLWELGRENWLRSRRHLRRQQVMGGLRGSEPARWRRPAWQGWDQGREKARREGHRGRCCGLWKTTARLSDSARTHRKSAAEPRIRTQLHQGVQQWDAFLDTAARTRGGSHTMQVAPATRAAGPGSRAEGRSPPPSQPLKLGSVGQLLLILCKGFAPGRVAPPAGSLQPRAGQREQRHGTAGWLPGTAMRPHSSRTTRAIR